MGMNAVYKGRAYRVGDESDHGLGVYLTDIETDQVIAVDYGDGELTLDPTDEQYFACSNITRTSTHPVATAEAKRDTANAVALGMVIGGLLVTHEDRERPEQWRDIGWDQIVADVNEVAAALDHYQAGQAEEFWEEHDWYLTLDAIGAELWKGDGGRWDDARITKCLVRI